MNIHINSFVKRQTPSSRFSHFTGTWEELADVAMARLLAHHWEEGYREGVILVDVPSQGFKTGVRLLAHGDALTGKFEARREGEEPRKVVTAVETYNKMPAKRVDLVLYASTVLAEDGSNELPAEEGNWEIISINANPFGVEMPIAPDTLMHNHFGSDGGTDTNLSDEDFVRMLRDSFKFWKDKVLCGEQRV